MFQDTPNLADFRNTTMGEVAVFGGNIFSLLSDFEHQVQAQMRSRGSTKNNYTVV
jgi:hypothetical protein